MLGTYMKFSIFDKRNRYQNRKENLAFATRANENVNKYIKNQLSIFQKLLGDRSLRLQLPRG